MSCRNLLAGWGYCVVRLRACRRVLVGELPTQWHLPQSLTWLASRSPLSSLPCHKVVCVQGGGREGNRDRGETLTQEIEGERGGGRRRRRGGGVQR